MEVEYVCSPKYFHTGDLIFDIFNTIILILISFFAFYAYDCIRNNTGICNKRYILIGSSFILLALSFAVKAFADYHFLVGDSAITTVVLSNMTFQSMCVFGGFIGYRILTIAALLLLYVLAVKDKHRVATMTVASLVLLNTVLFINDFIVFYSVSAILFFFIGLSYCKDLRGIEHTNQKLISLSFIIIAISYLLFALLQISDHLYAIAKIIRLIGFVLLLVSFMRVFYHGKKKK